MELNGLSEVGYLFDYERGALRPVGELPTTVQSVALELAYLAPDRFDVDSEHWPKPTRH